jgi:hypothetical protein
MKDALDTTIGRSQPRANDFRGRLPPCVTPSLELDAMLSGLKLPDMFFWPDPIRVLRLNHEAAGGGGELHTFFWFPFAGGLSMYLFAQLSI